MGLKPNKGFTDFGDPAALARIAANPLSWLIWPSNSYAPLLGRRLGRPLPTPPI
jgi:hypothetical protein